jgi:hypothetical protein
MVCSDEDYGRSRRLGTEDRGWSHRSGTRWSGDREVGLRRVRSAPCTWRRGARVSWLSLKTKVDSLSVVELQNQGRCSSRSRPVFICLPVRSWRAARPSLPSIFLVQSLLCCTRASVPVQVSGFTLGLLHSAWTSF